MSDRERGGDQLLVLEEVTGRLENAGVAYMVTGSVAMNYYAVPRMTRDVDFVVELAPSDVERFVAIFSQDYYLDPGVVVEAVAESGMFNLIHLATVIKIDFVVRKDTAYRREEFARRRSVAVDDVTIRMVAPEDLLLSKLEWARESGSTVQIDDVRNLIRSVRDLDWKYIERWATVLDVEKALDDVRGKAESP